MYVCVCTNPAFQSGLAHLCSYHLRLGIYVCVHVCIFIFIYAYMYTHTNLYTHIFAGSCNEKTRTWGTPRRDHMEQGYLMRLSVCLFVCMYVFFVCLGIIWNRISDVSVCMYVCLCFFVYVRVHASLCMCV